MNLRQLRGVITRTGKMDYPEHRDLVRQLGADSMVLLKNSGVLPMKKGTVALFGAGAVDTIFCGIYYNYVFTEGNVSVKEGLINNGFTVTTDTWLAKMEKAIKQAERDNGRLVKAEKIFGGQKQHPEEIPISVADMAEAILGTDTCIYVVRRSDEISDLDITDDKRFRLTEVEKENLNLIASSFNNVILVINSGVMEIASIARMKNIKAIILMGVPGMEAGNSLADILTGAVNPSGRLTDTWAKKYKDYSTCMSPSKLNKSATVNEIDYKEGIYVGYRYFDAFDVTPLYPFGYGLSYTTFDIKMEYFEASWISIMMKVKVTNTGDCAGREVVQVYCSLPEGKLEKPYQTLCGFGKTGKLKPGESEELTIKIPIMGLTSFDEESTAWIMEKGDYLFRIGVNSRDTKICAKVVLDRLTTIKKVARVMELKKELKFIEPPKRQEEDTGFIFVASLSGDDYNSANKVVPLKKEIVTYVPEGSNYVSYVNSNPYDIMYRTQEIIETVKPCSSATFFDVVKGNVSMEEFVASLSPEILARIAIGSMDEDKFDNTNRFVFNFNPTKSSYKLAGKTTAQFIATLGIPSVTMTDGPSGLHVPGVACTSFPAPINMAQTWDVGASIRMGRAYGREMEALDIDYCIAPAMNIHRNPMWDRSYEFYSEDPTLAGIMGAGFVMGVKRYEGRNCILKNGVTINQETGIKNVNINVSRRAFGELYLRPFSVCQFMVSPAGLLASSNKINGVATSSQRGLNTDIVRTDWGFQGFIMTDWGSDSDKGYDIHAGSDLIMPGYNPDKLLESMMNVSPTFADDGYVEVVEKAYMYKEPMIRYERWGSFVPDKNGDTTIVATVAAGNEISERALNMQQRGICEITDADDGSKIIKYKGFNRGPYMALGDLQQAVIHILNTIKDSAAMKKLLDSAKI